MRRLTLLAFLLLASPASAQAISGTTIGINCGPGGMAPSMFCSDWSVPIAFFVGYNGAHGAIGLAAVGNQNTATKYFFGSTFNETGMFNPGTLAWFTANLETWAPAIPVHAFVIASNAFPVEWWDWNSGAVQRISYVNDYAAHSVNFQTVLYGGMDPSAVALLDLGSLSISGAPLNAFPISLSRPSVFRVMADGCIYTQAAICASGCC